MKNAALLHGTGGRGDSFWFPFVQANLEERGYRVWAPDLPNTDHPNLDEWLPFVLGGMEFSEDTILIGHSAGSQLILSILEHIQRPIKQAVLVSGYAKLLRQTQSDDNTQEPNWNAAKEKAKSFIFINSDNDPWGCDDSQGRVMMENLGGALVIPHGEGHMGSDTYQQPYKKFPLLIKLLDL